MSKTPRHAGHLENLLKLARLGAIIAPSVRAFQICPGSVEDLVDHAIGGIGRVLDLLDLGTDLPHRWREAPLPAGGKKMTRDTARLAKSGRGRDAIARRVQAGPLSIDQFLC